MRQVLGSIEDVVEVGETFVLNVTGYSMLPLLGYAGDTIVVRRTSCDESIVGRIAMFRMNGGKIVVHRVVYEVDGVVHLRGDGNIVQVERVSRKDIVGIVEGVRRKSGKVVNCSSRWWRFREWVWLSSPRIVRRSILALLRRWLDYKTKH